MPERKNISFDSLVQRPRRRASKYFNVTKKKYYNMDHHYKNIDGIKGLEKMLANPAKKIVKRAS